MSQRYLLERIVGKFIDLAIVFVLASGMPRPLGPLAAFLYSVLADGMNFRQFQGQSVGKRVMRLQVVRRADGRPATLRDSALRNTPFGVAVFLTLFPVWGWILFALIGMPLMAMELWFLLRKESRRRLGDEMGDTEVLPWRRPV